MVETTEGISITTVKEVVENKLVFLSRMNLRTIDVRPRYVKLRAPLRENEDLDGSMYTGAQFTLAEAAGNALCLTTFNPATFHPYAREVSIRFVRPARTDVTVECSLSVDETDRIKAAAQRYGETEFVITCHLMDRGGSVVAVAKGFYQLREARN